MPKTAGGWISLAFHIMGGLAAAGPAIGAVVPDVQSGQFQNIGPDVLFAYTGVGTGGINAQQTAVGIGSVVGGIVIAKLGSYLGKVVR